MLFSYQKKTNKKPPENSLFFKLLHKWKSQNKQKSFFTDKAESFTSIDQEIFLDTYKHWTFGRQTHWTKEKTGTQTDSDCAQPQ